MNANVFEIRTEAQARASFWAEMPLAMSRHRVANKRQNDYSAGIREAWCLWVDAAQKSGRMSESLAQKVTL